MLFPSQQSAELIDQRGDDEKTRRAGRMDERDPLLTSCLSLILPCGDRLCVQNLRLKAVLGKPGVYPWSMHASYQSLCYQAAANYWQAKGALAEDDYGAEIAHLERARAVLAQARTREVGLLRNLADNRSRLDGALATRLAAAHKVSCLRADGWVAGRSTRSPSEWSLIVTAAPANSCSVLPSELIRTTRRSTTLLFPRPTRSAIRSR